jgi:hypothetical protein
MKNSKLESTSDIVKKNNKKLENDLLTKLFFNGQNPKLEISKIYDEIFNLPCELKSLKIDNLTVCGLEK